MEASKSNCGEFSVISGPNLGNFLKICANFLNWLKFNKLSWARLTDYNSKWI